MFGLYEWQCDGEDGLVDHGGDGGEMMVDSS